MDEKLLNSYLFRLDELIVEEDKIVTYKSLSNSLGIHVNTSKQLLYAYLSQKKNENFPVCATFLLAGKLKDGTLNITIVNETDKETEISKFIEITSDHVYSVQKGKSLKDIEVLCGIGKEIKRKESQCVIKCSKSIITRNTKDASSFIDCDKNKSDTECNIEGKSEEAATKSVGLCELKKNEQKQESFVSNLNENDSKSPKKSNSSDIKPKGEKKQNNIKGKKAAGNIENFFANASKKSSIKSNKDAENDSESSENNINKNIQDICEEQKFKKAKFEVDGERRIRKKNSKKNEVVKRKRIQVLSDSEDSDSSDHSSNSNEEPQQTDPDPEETIKVLKDYDESDEKTKAQNRRKKRKIVDSTVLNEDGYLETRKEITLVTDSEDEAEQTTLSKIGPFEKKDIKIDSKSKDMNNGNTSKKQTSLLTFFKKN